MRVVRLYTIDAPEGTTHWDGDFDDPRWYKKFRNSTGTFDGWCYWQNRSWYIYGEREPFCVPLPTNILAQVMDERLLQDAQWGGADHDDTHSEQDWVNFIYKQIGAQSNFDTGKSYRERMVKAAALAVAAIESYDRKNPA